MRILYNRCSAKTITNANMSHIGNMCDTKETEYYEHNERKNRRTIKNETRKRIAGRFTTI